MVDDDDDGGDNKGVAEDNDPNTNPILISMLGDCKVGRLLQCILL